MIKGVEEFALQLSEYIGREIGGSYFSNDGTGETTHMQLGNYVRNSDTQTVDFGYNLTRLVGTYFSSLEETRNYKHTAIFHTHPETGFKASD